MALSVPVTLDTLVDTYTRATYAPGEHPSPAHAGLAAVLIHLGDVAQHAIARDPGRYDHRSLYEFAAALRYATHPAPPEPAPVST